MLATFGRKRRTAKVKAQLELAKLSVGCLVFHHF